MPRTGRPPVPLAERFWAQVQKGPGCWEWTGSLNSHGYGKIGRSEGGRLEHIGAHRVSWELHFGPISDGQWVLHHCDNRACIRPDHLFLGTVADNASDMVRKGRSARGEHARSARLTAEQVREIRAWQPRSGETRQALAARMGASEEAIKAIRSGRTWRHV